MTRTAAFSLDEFATGGALRWYAVYTKAAKEDLAVEYIARAGLKAFNPKITRPRKVWGIVQQVSTPLFPCYIFARFDEAHFACVRYARGVRRIVGAGEVPTPLDEEIIDLIRARAAEPTPPGHQYIWKPGDKIRVTEGPLSGLQGVFENHLSSQERVRILLTAIEWQAHALIERRCSERFADEIH